MALENIGRYQIVAELGKGAMGVVYKATDPNIGRAVAIKTMRLDAHGVDPEDLVRRFKNEARAAGVMNHPNIVTIYDAGEHDGLFYIAMEYIEGQTLQAVLKEHRVLPVEKIVAIVRQVCAGLEYAHARGIIHRDIKPANIMIQTDGTAKIMDFGIAKFGGSGMTSTGQVVGTPNYMSPEAVKGRTVDGRSDLFGVGVILYEMLTGERPFTGESVTTIIYKIVNETPPTPRELDSSLHPGLSAVVMKALAKTPEQRYRTGAEFARDLQNYASLGTDATAITSVPMPDATLVMPAPPPATIAVPAPVPAAAPAQPQPATTAAASSTRAAAASPATVHAPSLESTIAAPPRPAAKTPTPGPAPKESRTVIAIVAAVVLVAIVGTVLLRPRRAAEPANPPAEGVTAPAASAAPQPEPAAKELAAESEPERASKPSAATPKQREGAAAKADSAKSAPAFGELQIASTPAGAAVSIDGRTESGWTTPFAAAKLKPGRHAVAFSLDGYQPETRQAEVAAGRKLPLDVQLQAAKAFLAVSSDPAGGQIFLDGHDTGQLTPSRVTVNPGKHRITVRKEGFEPQITNATVAAGEVFNFAPALPPRVAQAAAAAESPQKRSGNPFRKIGRFFAGNPGTDGTLEIRTRPKGAEILVNDKPAPSKTPAKFGVPPGNYTLTLRLPGYKPVTRAVTVEKGKITGVEEMLEPQ